jgi:cbb3-type cytochrome oxidase subunit 3
MHTEIAINNWRTALSKSGRFSTEQLDELESHLREELDQIQSNELNEEEKLLVAQHRIGSADTLKKAYNRFSISNYFPFITAIFMVFFYRLVSSVMLWSGTYVYHALTVDAPFVNYTLTIILQLCALGVTLIVYRHIERARMAKPEGLRSQFLLISYLTGSILIWSAMMIWIQPALLLPVQLVSQGAMIKSITDMALILVLIVALAIVAVRRKRSVSRVLPG